MSSLVCFFFVEENSNLIVRSHSEFNYELVAKKSPLIYHAYNKASGHFPSTSVKERKVLIDTYVSVELGSFDGSDVCEKLESFRLRLFLH